MTTIFRRVNFRQGYRRRSHRYASILFLLCPLMLPPAQAEFYKWIDADGNIHYTDQWREGAAAVDLPEPTVYSPRPIPSQEQTADASFEEQLAIYDLIEVSSPKPEETIRSNEGKVSVSLRLEPTLRQGDVIKLILDGNELEGEFRSTGATLTNVSRGTHSLAARVVDAEGKQLISAEPVSFYLRRASRRF